MPLFRVLYFKDGAGGGHVEHRDVEADDAQAAAEQVCGVPVVEDKGNTGRLRAQVQLKEDPSLKRMFYEA